MNKKDYVVCLHADISSSVNHPDIEEVVDNDNEDVEDPEDDPTPIPCVDENERCEEWSLDGECESNPEYMFQSCKASCGLCDDPTPIQYKDEEDEDDNEEDWVYCFPDKEDCSKFEDD